MEIVFSIDEIKDASKKLLPLFDHFKVFAFSGDLGAGKTTFIRAICKERGVEQNVTSPTYSIIQEYITGNGKLIYHMDLYRIKSKEEAMDAGIEDCINSHEICLIEWPEMVPEIFPLNTVFCKMVILENDERKLIVQLPR